MSRLFLEETEQLTLSPLAALSARSRGRAREEAPCSIRTAFMRDRDRILHCNSFRRLRDKTQVFLSPQGDHYRTRLTHTLEVAQIARTIARGLRLNEDLTEAIALGHDLGHTPFGHAGERALRAVCPHGFAHHIQSVRVVDHLEKGGQGLNLTWEVKNGIACHSDGAVYATTLEGKAVRLADKVAYINHDIEDAVRAGVLSENDLPYDCRYVLGRTKSERIATVLQSVLECSDRDITMAPHVQEAHDRLKAFMFEAVYTNPEAKSEEGTAMEMLKTLYDYYLHHPDAMPALYQEGMERYGKEQSVCDYVAGMTDQYAVDRFEGLFIPRFWTR